MEEERRHNEREPAVVIIAGRNRTAEQVAYRMPALDTIATSRAGGRGDSENINLLSIAKSPRQGRSRCRRVKNEIFSLLCTDHLMQ